MTLLSKRPNPIVLRPRKDSALDKAWQAVGRDNKKIGEAIHKAFSMEKDGEKNDD